MNYKLSIMNYKTEVRELKNEQLYLEEILIILLKD